MLPHPFHTQMSLHKLGVAMGSLASTSATCFATIAAGGSDHARDKMWTHSKALLASKDVVGRQHSATVVLPHPFHTQMRLLNLWVANRSLSSTLATRFAALPAGLRSGTSQNVRYIPSHSWPVRTLMAGSTVPQKCFHILSIPK